jgi:hypothetical protein
MRLQELLCEDVSTDTSAFANANAIRSAVINYLMRGNPDDHYGFKAHRFTDGDMMLCLRGAQIGLSDADASLWFRFGAMNGYTVSGNLSKFKRSGDPVITVFCLDDMQDTEAAAKIIIYRHPVHDVLIHELTHYLDSARNPTMHTIGTGEDKQGRSEYYNDPAEFNAFFTNFAHPLLAFVNAAADDPDPSGLARFAAATGITADFNQTLAGLIQRAEGQASPALKRYWAHLLPDRRKRLLRRLYALHHHAMVVLNRG